MNTMHTPAPWRSVTPIASDTEYAGRVQLIDAYGTMHEMTERTPGHWYCDTHEHPVTLRH